jgi:regulator of replication initiation timing
MTEREEVKALRAQVAALQAECGALMKQLTASREANYRLRVELGEAKKNKTPRQT